MAASETQNPEDEKGAAMSIGPRISGIERDHIVAMLRVYPLPEVKRRSRRSYNTLAKIAEAVL
jgi:hypothetical protein